MRIKMQLIGHPNETTVEFVLDRDIPEDARELQNVTRDNFMRVGAAIGKKRLAKMQVVGFPVAISF